MRETVYMGLVNLLCCLKFVFSWVFIDICMGMIYRCFKDVSYSGHEVVWNASTQPSGVYFVQLVSGNNVQMGKVILIK